MNARPDLPGMLPNADRVRACREAPQRGPRILFFSGGTALRGLSRVLIEYTHNSIHLVTPFDSGGSSASLRRAFGMPSIGDLRNRLIALAAATTPEDRAVHRILSHRLPKQAHPNVLRQLLLDVAAGSGSLMLGLANDVARTIRQHITDLIRRLPDDFDLRGASFGNLVLTASYLAHDRDLDAAIEDISGLLQTQGAICATSKADVQLAAQLADGSTVVGQHLLTGKEAPQLSSAIADIWLTAGPDQIDPVHVPMSERAGPLLAQADLICYPMGSFHSSVAANLLPTGIGAAISANPCPKVYVPNTGVDPEQKDTSMAQCARILIDLVRRDAADAAVTDILQMVLVDHSAGHYAAPVERDVLEGEGLEVRAMDLVTTSAPRIDDRRLAEALVSISTWEPR